MVDSLTELEFTVLGWVGNDYESLNTIDKNVIDDMGREVSLVELHDTLVALQSYGLVNSYKYDVAATRYNICPIDPNEATDQYWWLANPDGLRCLEMAPEDS